MTDDDRQLDLFGNAEHLTASTEGADIGPFELELEVPSRINTDFPCPPEYNSNSDLVVRWTKGARDLPVRLVMRARNHGYEAMNIICDSKDDGEIVVDQSIISAYLELRESWRAIDLWELFRYSEIKSVVDNIPVTFRVERKTKCAW